MSATAVVFVLRTPAGTRDLDGHVFGDEETAAAWMAQLWDPAAQGYRVERWTAKRTTHRCPRGDVVVTRLVRRVREYRAALARQSSP